MLQTDNSCIEKIEGEGKYKLNTELHLDYFDDYEGMVDITIPKNYETDLSSIPPKLISACPISKFIKVYFVYDYICKHPEYRRPRGFEFYKDEADQLLVKGMDALGISWWKRLYAYFCIKFHTGEWRKYREDGH